MTNLKAKAGMIIATSALMISLVPGVFAASNVDVSVTGNGAGSHNTVDVTDTTDTTVKQENNVSVVNVQSATSSTGGNTISGSTGDGSNGITTGDASSSNVLKVMGGSNTVVTDGCGCDNGSTSVDVSGNGVHSKTKVKVTEKTTKKTTQKSNTVVSNVQDAKSKTGNNKVKNSTGSDSNSVETGDATTKNKAVVTTGDNFSGPSIVL